MRTHVLLSLTLLVGFFTSSTVVQAQSPRPNDDTVVENVIDLITESEATQAATATPSAEASVSAKVEQKIQEKTEQDITQTTSEPRSRLAQALIQKNIGDLSWHNFLQHAIRSAVDNGLPANIVVLVLLFPLITSIIAISRHVIGLKGFGIYIPAVLSVALVSTGIATGMAFFVVVLTTASIARPLVKRLRLPYLPRTAMLLWGVSLVILALLLVAAHLPALFSLLTINIFPLLIVMLLTENFIESQQFNSQKEAVRLTLETVFIAVVCSLFISAEAVQQAVILNPEITVFSVAIINLIVGRYAGLRLTEYIRFHTLMDR